MAAVSLCFALSSCQPAHYYPEVVGEASPPAIIKGTTTTITTTTTTPPPTTVPPPPPRVIPPSTVAKPAPNPFAASVRFNEAISLVEYPWQEVIPDWQIVLRPSRTGYLAQTFLGQQRIEVYIRLNISSSEWAGIITHEIGHAVDSRYNTWDRRDEYGRIRGIGGQWYACSGCTDFATGSGDYAESFSYRFSPPHQWRSRMGSPPNSAQLSRLEHLFWP